MAGEKLHDTEGDTDRLIRREYIGSILGHFATQLPAMTNAEKSHSAGVMANTFLTFNVTNGFEPYSINLEALTEVEQATVADLFEAAGWGEVFHGTAMRRISSHLQQAFDRIEE